MKTFLIIVIVFLTASCIPKETYEQNLTSDQILSDSSFVQLVELLHYPQLNNPKEWEYWLQKVSSLILYLQKSYVDGKSQEELTYLEDIIRLDLAFENSRIEPLREFSTTHLVNAPIEIVWQTLVEVDEFPLWNEFTPMVETTFELNSPIIMTVRLFPLFPNNTLIQRETVVTFNDLDEMCWESVVGSNFWMKSHRCYQVDRLDENHTYLTSNMRYTGVLAPIVNALTKPLVLAGFNDVAVGLKERVE